MGTPQISVSTRRAPAAPEPLHRRRSQRPAPGTPSRLRLADPHKAQAPRTPPTSRARAGERSFPMAGPRGYASPAGRVAGEPRSPPEKARPAAAEGLPAAGPARRGGGGGGPEGHPDRDADPPAKAAGPSPINRARRGTCTAIFPDSRRRAPRPSSKRSSSIDGCPRQPPTPKIQQHPRSSPQGPGALPRGVSFTQKIFLCPPSGGSAAP